MFYMRMSKLTTFTHFIVNFSVSRPIIFLPYFLCRPARAPQELGAPVHWTAWTPGFYATETDCVRYCASILVQCDCYRDRLTRMLPSVASWEFLSQPNHSIVQAITSADSAAGLHSLHGEFVSTGLTFTCGITVLCDQQQVSGRLR